MFQRDFSQKELPKKITLKASGLISLGGQGNEIKVIPRRKVSVNEKKRFLKVQKKVEKMRPSIELKKEVDDGDKSER